MSATPDNVVAYPEQLIADLQHQIAECKAERDEALQRETATAEVLQVINSSSGDLAPVFDAMLDKATRLCEAAVGFLIMVDREELRPVAMRNVPEALAEYVRPPLQPEQFPLIAGVIRQGQVLHVHDAADTDGYRQRLASRVAGVEVGGARTMLYVPLINDGRVLGVFVLHRQEVRLFTDKQIALLQNFAAQAVIAMENARLLTETREALEKQTATTEILRVISRSPTDLQPTFDAIAARAKILTGAATGNVFRFDGSLIHLVASYGPPDALQAMEHSFPAPAGRQGVTTRAIQAREVVHVADVATDPDYALPAIVEAGWHTGLAVPMLQDGNPVGAITVTRREVAPFSQSQIDLLMTFADQAVIAIENVRLFNELDERTRDLRESLEYQTATSEVLQVISRSTFDLQSVLDTLVATAARLCGADAAMISTRRCEVYRVTANYAMSPEWDAFARTISFRPGRDTVTGRALLERQPVQIADVTVDPEHKVPEAATIGNLRTILCVPLLREGEPVGMIQLARSHVELFTKRQIELVRIFADQAVIAMENARLLDELRQSTEEVAELNRGLEARVAEQVDELGRVGRLKRFLAPQLAELIVSQGDEKILESHRREIVVVFCDLRGYTAFTETAEPEEVLDFLREYHGALGPLISQFEGTLDQFSGDGIMVFFNDPVPIPDPAARAVNMAVAMRDAASSLISSWRRLGRELGFGAGIAQGYATLGQIGFSERSGYTAIGTVCNVAARLCAEARDGQILISQRVAARLDENTTLEDIGALSLKGLTQPVVTYNVPLAVSQPALRVIEGGPSSV